MDNKNITPKEGGEKEAPEKVYVESITTQIVSKWPWVQFIAVELAIVLALLMFILATLTGIKNRLPKPSDLPVIEQSTEMQDTHPTPAP